MHEVPITWIRHVAAVEGPQSAVVEGALKAAGLPRRVLADDTQRVRDRAYVEFVEAAARLARDDIFGLRLGQSYDLRASGLAGYVSIAAATLGEAFRNATRYGGLNDTAADYALAADGELATFRIETRSAPLRGNRHATEFKVAFIVAACRRWIGGGFRPAELRFAHARASSLREVARAFGCPVRFGADATELVLAADQLALPVRGADPYLLALVMRHADETLTARAARRDGLRARVERLVLRRLPNGAPTAAEVAEALGIGERTFARRLAAEGAPFRRVVEELRRDLARSYLADPNLTLAQIAFLLGYAEQSAFTNAFRRWTGRSPRGFRAAPG
jgi:AraC-like DNA-binding protein